VEEGGLIGKSLCVSLIFFLTATTGHATAHVFVQTSEGVWLGSDSLIIHKGHAVNRCKVVISRGRLIFNAGFFKDSTLLRVEEAALPLKDARATRDAILELLKTNHMDLTGDPKHTPDQAVVNAGILQVDGEVFTELMFGQADDLRTAGRYVKDLKMGVPHGFGDSINRVRDAAYKDPALATWIQSRFEERPMWTCWTSIVLQGAEVEVKVSS
jgi:hypothetical protein